MNIMFGLNRNVCLVTTWAFHSYVRLIVTKSSTVHHIMNSFMFLSFPLTVTEWTHSILFPDGSHLICASL